MTGVFPFTRILCENMHLSEVVRYSYFMRKYAPFGGRANIPGWICAR